MKIAGLPEFTFAQVNDYVTNHSDFLPVLGKIKLPKDVFPDYESLETNIKICAGQLGYLRLVEKQIAKEIDELLPKKREIDELREKKNPSADSAEAIEVCDRIEALNRMKAEVLSLNERITIETFDYIYMNIIRRPEADSKKEVKFQTEQKKLKEELSGIMHGQRALKLEKTLKFPSGLWVRNDDDEFKGFGAYLKKVKEYLTKMAYQSEKVDLPSDESLYFREYVQGPSKLIK